MKVDTFNITRDYEEVCSWWVDHKVDPIEARYLGYGYIIKGFCALFVYPTGTPVCFMENLVANKNTDKVERDAAIDLLVSTVCKLLRLKGVEQITSVSKLSIVNDRALKKHGFTKSEEKYNILNKTLS